MKNFHFPQLFQTVVEDDQLTNLSHWHSTSRRFKTQMQSSLQQTKIKNVKSSRYNFLIQPSKPVQDEPLNNAEGMNVQKQTQNFQTQSGNNLMTTHFSNRSKLSNINYGKQNKYRIAKYKRFNKQKSIGLEETKHSEGIEHKNQQQRLNQNQDSNNKVSNMSNIRLNKKLDNNFSNRKIIGQNTSNESHGKNSKQNKYMNNKINTQKTNVNNKVKIKQKNLKQKKQINHQSIHLSEKSIKSNRIINSKSRKLLQSTKKIKVMKSLSGRRFGMETKQQMQFDGITEQMQKIINNNKLILQRKNHTLQKDHKQQQIINSSESSKETTKKSFKEISLKNIKQSRKSRKMLTMHAFKSQEPPKKQKKSYTIWDLKESSQQQMDEEEEDKIDEQTKNNNQKKKKKKVHFGRTSIQEKAQKSKTKISNGYITTRRSIKLKGIIQRFANGQQAVSIGDILMPQKPQAKKIFKNDTSEIKKTSKLKKMDTDNVYNQLNYFRMRMNMNKTQQQEVSNPKPHPQAIILTIQKVMNQLQNQRIQRTRLHNMMIDFGIKITRGYNLKQIGAKQKIVNHNI